MKILHTADIHLGSKNIKLPIEKRKLMKDEVAYNLRIFFEMAQEYDVVIICGDLFDTSRVANSTIKTFLSCVKDYGKPLIYIEGNHDAQIVFSDGLPENFINLNEREIFTYKGVNFVNSQYNKIDIAQTNILLLHGNIESKTDNDYVDLLPYLNRGYDYIALGHLHTYKKFDFSPLCAYPGCLFSYGFDECGEKGFISLEIENKQVQSIKFVPMPARKYVICECPIDGAQSMVDVVRNIKEIFKNNNVTSKDIVRVLLKGTVPVENEISTKVIEDSFDQQFYIEVIDNTKQQIDFDKIKSEKLSFKYEFISLVENSELSDEDKKAICRLGIEALRGDDITL